MEPVDVIEVLTELYCSPEKCTKCSLQDKSGKCCARALIARNNWKKLQEEKNG